MDYFHYKDMALYAEDVPVEDIAKAVGTPFYCYSSATIVRHYRVFKEALASMNPLICYAVKANTTLAVLKTLAVEGSGADVVSAGEIHFALAAGIPAEKIIFSGVGKTYEEMEYALSKDIFQFNIESESELHTLAKAAATLRKIARIAVRVNPDVVPDTHAKISTGQKESKFGVPIADASRIYAEAAKRASIKIQGVSVHIGSQLSNLMPFMNAFTRVVDLVRKLRAEGHTITTLDLGGGLGIPYGDQEAPPLPSAYAEMVKLCTDGINCQLIFEPGRVLVGNAGILVTKVIYLKRNAKPIVIVDAGMNDLVRPTIYDAYHDIIPVKVNEGASTELVDVVGPVCESSDTFASNRLLKVPKEGDLLAFRSAGAYGTSMASTYNQRPLVAEVMVKGSQFAVVRPRQTYDEMLHRDKLPQWLD